MTSSAKAGHGPPRAAGGRDRVAGRSEPRVRAAMGIALRRGRLFDRSDQGVGSPAYVVRTPRADDIASDIRALMREHVPASPMYRVFAMERLAQRSMAQGSFHHADAGDGLGPRLFGVGSRDVPTFVAMSGVMLAVALLASYVPARRASSVDPMESLHAE